MNETLMKRNLMEENLQKIAKYYGKKAQLEQLIEESAELIVAVRKYLREAEDLPFVNVVEEIADVEVMTNQIKYLFGIENKVEEIKAAKIEQRYDYIRGTKRKMKKNTSSIKVDTDSKNFSKCHNCFCFDCGHITVSSDCDSCETCSEDSKPVTKCVSYR